MTNRGRIVDGNDGESPDKNWGGVEMVREVVNDNIRTFWNRFGTIDDTTVDPTLWNTVKGRDYIIPRARQKFLNVVRGFLTHLANSIAYVVRSGRKGEMNAILRVRNNITHIVQKESLGKLCQLCKREKCDCIFVFNEHNDNGYGNA